MSTAEERLMRALDAIECNCTPVELERGHRPGCWMPGLVAARDGFVPGDVVPWIAIADVPAPRDRELIVACVDWPHGTELGRPVPVRIGVVDQRGRWTVWGADWTPTHYKLAPTGPRQARGVAH